MSISISNAIRGVACAALLSVGLPAAANAASGAYGAQGYGTTMYQTNWLYWGSVIQPVGSIPSTATLANIYWSIDSTSSINYNSGKRYRILHNNTSYMDVSNASGGTSAFTGLAANKPFQFGTYVTYPTTKVMSPYIYVGVERITVNYNF